MDSSIEYNGESRSFAGELEPAEPPEGAQAPSTAEAGEKGQLSAAMEIASAINSRTDLDNILQIIVREFSKVLDFDVGCVAVYEKEENCLYIRHIFRKNGDKTGEGRRVPLEETNLVGWVAMNRKPILRCDIPSDRRFAEIMREDGLKSDIVVPLVANNALIGTVNFGSYSLDRYSGKDLELIERFSRLTAIAIERAQLLNELKGLGEKYKVLMKSSNDIIMFLNLSGRILECNDAVERILGYPAEDVIGKSPADFTPLSRRETALMNLTKIARGEIKKAIEVPYITIDGKIVYIDVNIDLIKIKNMPFVLAVGHDVTNRKVLEKKITIQNRELKLSNRKLLEVDQLKSEFLGRISHELRTPLSVIMAYTGALRENGGEGVDPDTREEFLEIIDLQSKKLLSLINDLLDLSKLEVSETMLNLEEGSMNETVNFAINIIAPYATRSGVEIVFSADDNIPLVRFDQLRIRQVCVNLLNNAIKFTPQNGRVIIASVYSGDEIIISVTDQGPGIAKEDIPLIFDNFTQVDGGTSREWSGMGIGLRLVKHYIALHHGRVWVESDRGKGSTFFLSIPAVPAECQVKLP